MRNVHRASEKAAPTGVIQVKKDNYRVVIDKRDGRVRGLFSSQTNVNWVADAGTCRFGVPFFKGTQDQETFLELLQPRLIEAESKVVCVSPSGLTRLEYTFLEERIDLWATLPPHRGPRAGLSLDLNILDMPTGTPWTDQVTPVILYTDEELAYAYFVWHRSAQEYLVLVVDGPFAAWRIKYSYAGHLMRGFQVLSQADDVLCPGDASLPAVEQLCIRLAFAHSIGESLNRVAELLGLALVVPSLSGGIVHTTIPLRLLGETKEVLHRAPDGTVQPLTMRGGRDVLFLDQPGIHEIIAVSRSGRRHVTRLIAHEEWQRLFDRCNRFYQQHFQHECGAFYRAISVDTLMPDKVTFEGVPFGDPSRTIMPNSCRNSCRTGEFGGFAAWAMIKNRLTFGLTCGEKSNLVASVDRYIFNWALNRGHEHHPYPGTVCKQPTEFLGRQFSAYHLYHEINYPQYEMFLLGELIDYFRLTGDAGVLEETVRLGEHFIRDHVQPNGMVVCQNSADDVEHDYTTVDVPGIALYELGSLLKDQAHEKGTFFLSWAERVADFLVRRGLNFPTEGEACTEDGSLACTAYTLLYAYLHLKPKPEYLRLGRQLVELHEKLVLQGCDCRLNNSSLRFWETQYESAAWGPSINAGHGWTIWTAQAKVCLYFITGQIRWLREAYAGYLSNLSLIDANGGMFPCFTPDMVPGTPHAYPWGQPLEKVQDTQQTSTFLAMRYPDAYSASGNHALIRAAETWSFLSGLIVEDGTPINGCLERDRTFVSAAPKFNRLALSSVPVPDEPLKITTRPGQELTITFDGPALEVQKVQIDNAVDIRRAPSGLRCRVAGSSITIRRNYSRQRRK